MFRGLKVSRPLIAHMMQGEDIFECIVTGIKCLHFSMQGEDIFEHTNGKCQLCTL